VTEVQLTFAPSSSGLENLSTHIGASLAEEDPEAQFVGNNRLRSFYSLINYKNAAETVFKVADSFRYKEGRYLILQRELENTDLAIAEIDVFLTERGKRSWIFKEVSFFFFF